MEKKRIRTETVYQTLTITKAAGAPDGLTMDPKELNSDYSRCTGLGFVEISDGGIANGHYEIGIKHGEEIIHDPVHKNMWEAGPEVSPNRKYKDIFMDLRHGKETRIMTNLPASPPAQLSYQVIFRLERNVEEEIVNV